MEKLQANGKKEDIMEVLEGYKKELEAQGYFVAGLFLHGSQNYGMDQPGDNVDAYAVVFPGAESFAFDLPMTVKEKMPTGEVTIKDIRLFAAGLLSGHYTMLELLLTPYCMVEWNYFKSLLNTKLCERVLLYDMQNTVASILETVGELRKGLQEQGLGRQLKDLASIMHLHQMAYALVGCAKKYGNGTRAFSIANDFCHAFHDGELMGEARALAATDPALVGAGDLKGLMSAMGRRDKDVHGICVEWAAQCESLPQKAIEKEQMETKRMVAEWVESAFSLFWTR